MNRCQISSAPSRPVSVVDDEVPLSGWHAVDLSNPASRWRLGGVGVRATLHNPSALRSLGGVPVPFVGPRPSACEHRDGVAVVPRQAFVEIGRSGISPAGPRPTRRLARSANDNKPSTAGAQRPVWRDLLLLTLLFATVAGAFWSGRLHAAQKVIVVPGPSSSRSVVT